MQDDSKRKLIHDMKTPISVVKNVLESWLEEGVIANEQEGVSLMQRALQRMDDTLEAARDS